MIVIPTLLWYLLSLLGQGDASQSSFSTVDGSTVLMAVLITVAAAGGLGGLLVFGLWVYHLYLMYNGVTTKEHWKGTRPMETPEELSLLVRRGPRLFDPRALVASVPAPAGDDGPRWRLETAGERVTEIRDHSP